LTILTTGQARTLFLSLAVALGLTACAGPEPLPPAPAPVAAPAAPVVAEPEPVTLGELLAGIEAAYRKGDYNRGLALVKKVYELKQADVTTLDRVGSIYYVLGRYGEALTVWQTALPMEKNLSRRRELAKSITVARQTLGLGPEGQPSATPAARPKPVVRPKPPVSAVVVNKNVIEKLYQSGVKHYAAGEYLQATTIFLRIAALDPGNAKAAKALERLHLEGAASAP
jgi:tetratricopeptide (TPR) repeat protein